jgi:hypothetical protein
MHSEVPIVRFVVWGVLLAIPFLLVSGAGWVVLSTARPRLSRQRRLVVSVVLATAVLGGIQVFTLDGVKGLVFSPGSLEDTEYAPGYSALGFFRVREGMRDEQVRGLLGEPLDTYPIRNDPRQVGWRWTRSPGDTDYRVRVVIFRDGRVTRRHSEYYID